MIPPAHFKAGSLELSSLPCPQPWCPRLEPLPVPRDARGGARRDALLRAPLPADGSWRSRREIWEGSALSSTALGSWVTSAQTRCHHGAGMGPSCFPPRAGRMQEPQQTDKRGKTHGLSFLTLETEFLKSNYQFTGHISPPFTPGSTSPATESFSCHFLTQSHHRLAHAGQASPQKHFRQS